MHVALVIGQYNAVGGGAERWTDRHARFLLQRGYRVTLLARRFQGVPKGARTCLIPDRPGPGRRLRFARAIEAHVTRERFDVVHDMGEGWSADVFMPHHGTRVAGFEQNIRLLPPWFRPVERGLHRWLPRYQEFAELERRQYSLDRPTLVVAISRMVARDMQQHYQVPEDRIRLVYNGVDINQFAPGENRVLRRQWGWDDRTIFMLMAHNFRLKGLPATIEALSQLTRRGRRVGLIVLGNGPTRPFRRQARRLGCADDVLFLGDQADPVPFYRAADVYVQPTYYDPCSLVVLEAMATGLPVITTKANGAGELITPGVEGDVLADPEDVAGLADRMDRWTDPLATRRAAEAARELMTNHSLERNSLRLLELYAEHAAAHSRRRAG